MSEPPGTLITAVIGTLRFDDEKLVSGIVLIVLDILALIVNF